MKKKPKPRPNFIHGISDFARLHLGIEDKLRRLSVTPRNRKKLSDDAVQNLHLRARAYLPAGNLRARTCLAEWILSGFMAEGLPRDDDYFHLTLVPSGFAYRANSHGRLDIAGLIASGSIAMEGLDYLAAIDVGAYVSLRGEAAGRRETWHSPHVHAIVWSASEDYMEGLEHGLNIATEPFLPGLLPVHFRRLSYEVCQKRLLYAFKFPLHEYQAWPMLSPKDADQKQPPLLWKQKPKPIRPGTAAGIANHLAEFSLDQITFAGGQGRHILDAALRDARDEMSSAERHRMKAIYGPQRNKERQ
ncbi:hypothetical protein [Mesorhizobium sp. B1-1-5]|uniref:hypothetical protein n=1 Tax=Mesorhizobium sp. B1-1-5 TaxID=2589979 RepID=UPI00112AE84E|nr:hypothetical protein [Mesorhizobium sp. B1-1-5]TPO13711.1 hypothetical protein FJ980_00575 [Mesorhizobium sp. B1-1-5]